MGTYLRVWDFITPGVIGWIGVIAAIVDFGGGPPFSYLCFPFSHLWVPNGTFSFRKTMRFLDAIDDE